MNDMTGAATSYDAIPYPSVPFPESHPGRLSAIAMLFGLDAPDLETCRVLELGCSMGNNLLAIAQIHPGSTCVGVDASSHQIAEGRKTLEALGAGNVRLQHADILEIDAQFGEFDYIICHGVYSWVPAAVQEKILQICRQNLSPNGVAYISYNTYPGWHIRGIVRDMMFYRGTLFTDPAARLAQAKALVEFVAQSGPDADSPYRRLLQDEFSRLVKHSDYYLHHEHLEEHNQPLYFHQFAKRLAAAGLQYLGEAEFSMMVSTNFPQETAAKLHQLGAHDIVQMEQYMDFVRCRYFRKTLICHKDARLNRTIDASLVKNLRLASIATAEQAGDDALDVSQSVSFRTPRGYKLACRRPLTKLAMRILREAWPSPVGFHDLLAQSLAEAQRRNLPVDAKTAESLLASDLLTGMATDVIEWRRSPPPFTTRIGNAPEATRLARLQAEQGYKVTNLRGETVTLDEIHRQTLKLLDGTRSFDQTIDALIPPLKRGDMTLRPDGAGQDGAPVTGEPEMRTLLRTALPKVLQNLAKNALFVAGSPRPD
ncbi:MAG: class I SAM-dependent methyltransferase [Burkholderiales bacterium]